jgi:hypothetical protein
MKHLAAYLLLGLGGNASPSAKDIKAVLESVGIEADSERLDKLLEELKGKDINEVCSLCLCGSSLDANNVNSSSLKVPKSWLAFHLAEVVAPLLEVLLEVLPLVVLPRRPRPKRKRKKRRNPTTTWVSGFSIKRLLLKASLQVQLLVGCSNKIHFIIH